MPESDAPPVLHGTVKFFNDEKGWGFLIRDDGGPELFVHWKQIVGDGYRSLTEGQAVTFTIGKGPKGDEAQNVTPVA